MKTSPFRMGFLETLAICALTATPLTVQSTVVSEQWGSDPPKNSLGGYQLEAFPADSRGIGDLVTSFDPPASSPVTGSLMADADLEHRRIGEGWGTWSHGYSGDVYWLDEDLFGNELTLTLPSDTKAFYLYLEPNFFGTYQFVVNSGLATETLAIDGLGGAKGVGFYTDVPSDSLASIAIRREGGFSDGFAVGEFGINSIKGVPEGGVPPTLFGILILGLFGAHRKLSRQAETR